MCTSVITMIFKNKLHDSMVTYGHMNLIFQQLSSTVIIFRNLVEAIITNDHAAADRLIQDLYKNANERAAYMASINPFWDETQWKYLIYTFYNYSFQEIISILTGDPKNIDLFDRFLQYADSRGDYFSQGLYNYLTYKQPREMVSDCTQ